MEAQLCKDCEYKNKRHKLHHKKCSECFFYKDNLQSNFKSKINNQ